MNKFLLLLFSLSLCSCEHPREATVVRPLVGFATIAPEQLVKPGMQLEGENELRLLIYASEINEMLRSPAEWQEDPVIALDVTPVEGSYLRAPLLPKPWSLRIGLQGIYEDRQKNYHDRATRRHARVITILILKTQENSAQSDVQSSVGPFGSIFLRYTLSRTDGKWHVTERKLVGAS